MKEAKVGTEYDDEEENEEFNDSSSDFMFYDCEEEGLLPDDPIKVDTIDSSSVTFIENRTVPEASLRRRRGKSSKPSAGEAVESSIVNSSLSWDKISNPKESKDSKLSEDIPETENSEFNQGPSGAAFHSEASGTAIPNHELDSNLILLLASLMVKGLTFQIHLLVQIITFPINFFFNMYTILFDPFRFLNGSREYLLQISRSLCVRCLGWISSSVYNWLMEHKAIWKFSLRCGWGLIWSTYVCSVLIGLLVSAFVLGGLLVHRIVEEPVRMKSSLNFDYTEKSPVAYVPLAAKHELNQDVYIAEKAGISGRSGPRAIPPDHKLQVTVSLRVPESDYNHNLGIFQVRVDFLASNGKPLASSRRPCMLLYRSQPIHLLLTFLKLAPILTGYTTETQTLKTTFKGFVEGDTPTACIRVVMEQRAEYLPGAGIPEIYDASFTLDSELPILKRIVWSWRKTVFVWISISVFMMELMFGFICCKPIIMPRIRIGHRGAY